MSKDLTVKPEAAMAVMKEMFGEESGIEMSDISIGRISVMNALSVPVQDDLAKSGQILNRLDDRLLADKGGSFEIIPIRSFKYWIEKENDNFKSRYPATSPDEKLWSEGAVTRHYHHSFYVLLADELKEGLTFPVEIPFTSTGLPMARKLSSLLAKMWMRKIPTWGRSFTISAVEKTKDKNKWYTFNVADGRVATKDEMSAAASWNEILKVSSDDIKHTEERDTPPPAPKPASMPRDDYATPGSF